MPEREHFCCEECSRLSAAIRAEFEGEEILRDAVLLIIETEDYLKEQAS